MPYHFYILYSESIDRFYYGHTSNLSKRIERHNAGKVKSTKSGIPWVLKHSEGFATKSDAMKREYEVKRWKNRKLVEALIAGK